MFPFQPPTFPCFHSHLMLYTFSALHWYMPQMRASLPSDFLASLSTSAQHSRLHIAKSFMDGLYLFYFGFLWTFSDWESYFKSNSLSFKGSLPLACYPDIGPFGNIMPLNSISAVSKVSILSILITEINSHLHNNFQQSFGMRHHQQMGRNGDHGGNEDPEQSYRATIM